MNKNKIIKTELGNIVFWNEGDFETFTDTNGWLKSVPFSGALRGSVFTGDICVHIWFQGKRILSSTKVNSFEEGIELIKSYAQMCVIKEAI